MRLNMQRKQRVRGWGWGGVEKAQVHVKYTDVDKNESGVCSALYEHSRYSVCSYSRLFAFYILLRKEKTDKL